MAATAHWEHFPHQADVGVRGLGATLEQAFEQAALALTAVITDLEIVAPKEMLQISCMAPNAELLLVDWLNSLIFEMVTRNMLFSRGGAPSSHGGNKGCDLYCAEGCPTTGRQLARPVCGGRVAAI